MRDVRWLAGLPVMSCAWGQDIQAGTGRREITPRSEASLQGIRQRIREQGGIAESIIAGSHAHYGPVLELTDEPGKGKGRFDVALRYYGQMEDGIVAAILEANTRLAPARIAVGSAQLEGYNRNRQTRIEPKASDRELAVMRLDSTAGKPIAVVANFAAHPTMLPPGTRRFSAGYVGAMKAEVTRETGAAGDQSVNEGTHQGYQAFGQALGREAALVANSLEPRQPAHATLECHEERFRFDLRTDFANPRVRTAFEKAFSPELIPNYLDEYADGIRPRLTAALLDGEIALVGVSGEAVAEGGYGADNAVSPAAAGEQIMDTALIRIYQMLGRIKN